ncbi:MAG: hypothetical protein Q9168_005406 [Polycauliona sp. 1 TL-2023]
MEAIGVAASLAQLIESTAKTIKYLNGVREASKDRAVVLQEVSSLLPLLVSLQTQVDESKQSEPHLAGIRSLAVTNGPLDQLRDALENLARKLKPKKGIENAARNIIWTLDKAYCVDLLNKIERVKSSICLVLQGDTFKLAQAIKADTAGIGNVDLQVTAVSQSLELLHVKEDASKRQQILAWLSPLNFFKAQQDMFARREDGTGDWLIESSTFKDWLSGLNRKLCCTGIPGAGKSILASVIVDFLQKRRTTTSAIGIAVLYCNFKEKESQTFENLLAGACAQLAYDMSGPLPVALTTSYESHSEKKTKPVYKEIVAILEEVVCCIDTGYIVVDAMDECSEEIRNDVLTTFEALPDKIRLLITTRHVDDLIHRYRNCPRIEIRATDSDLKKYIETRIENNKNLARYVLKKPSLRYDIYEGVAFKANGMFLAAKLHVDALSTKISISRLKEALKSLPTTLDGLYNDAFSRIETQDEESRQLAHKALRWVAFTYRPLESLALQEALATDPEEEDFDRDRIPHLGLVLDVCAGLLTVDMENRTVRLVHYTAQDYLDNLLPSKFLEAHAFIAGDCITYLNYKCFRSHALKDIPIKNIPNSDRIYHLLAYASSFWVAHSMCIKTPGLVSQMHRYITSTPRAYLRTPKDYDNILAVHLMPRYMPEKCHGYGIAAFYGLCEELTNLLQHIDHVDQSVLEHDPGYGGGSALHLAAGGDQAETILILLDHGADIENRTSKGDTALIQAIKHKSLTVAELLVQRGANVMVRGFNQHTPFQRVWWRSPIPFLKYLIAAGTLLERRHLFEESPLTESIAENKDLQTIRWLFETALSDSDRALIPSTALYLAVEWGSLYWVEALLDCGADVNQKNGNGSTALHDACRHGDHAIINSLVQRGINIDERNKRGETALHEAIGYSQEGVLILLTRHKPDLDLQDVDGFTPLMKAVASSLTSIALHLLHCGAGIHHRTTYGMTVLHLASRSGDTAVVQELIERQIWVGCRSMFTLTAKNPPQDRNYRKVDPVRTCLLTCQYHTVELFALCAQDRSKVQYWFKYWFKHWLQDERKHHAEWSIWKHGMTALDIAVLRGDHEIIRLLAPLSASNGQPDAITRDEFFFEVFGVSSINEVLEILEEEEVEQKDRGVESSV